MARFHTLDDIRGGQVYPRDGAPVQQFRTSVLRGTVGDTLVFTDELGEAVLYVALTPHDVNLLARELSECNRRNIEDGVI